MRYYSLTNKIYNVIINKKNNFYYHINNNKDLHNLKKKPEKTGINRHLYWIERIASIVIMQIYYCVLYT